MSLQQNNSRIAKNTIFLSIRMVIVLLVSLYSSRVILQTLGVEDFGIYNVVGGFVSMFAFLNTSMNNAIQRFYNYEIGKNGSDGERQVYNTALVIQICLAVVIIVATETFGLWYIYHKMVIPPERFSAALWIFQFSIASLVLLIVQIPYSAAIMAHEKMNYYAVVSVLDAVLKLGVAILVGYVPSDKLVGYGFMLLGISVVNFCLYFFYAKHYFKDLKIKRHFEKGLFKKMLSFSGWNLFGSFARVMKEQGLNMLLNLFFGPVVNAARGVAYQVSGALHGFVNNITIAARPQLTQAYAQGKVSRTMAIMFSVSKLCYVTLLLMAMPIMLEIDFILHIWLGNNIPDNTNIFVILVIITSLIHVFNPPTSFVVHATGKMKKYQLISGCINLLILPVSYILLKLGYPAASAFIVSAFFALIGQVAAIKVLRSLVIFSIKQYLVDVIVPALAITIIALLVSYIPRYFMNDGWLRLLMVTIFSCVAIIASMLIVGMTTKEKEMMFSIVSNKLKISRRK